MESKDTGFEKLTASWLAIREILMPPKFSLPIIVVVFNGAIRVDTINQDVIECTMAGGKPSFDAEHFKNYASLRFSRK